MDDPKVDETTTVRRKSSLTPSLIFMNTENDTKRYFQVEEKKMNHVQETRNVDGLVEEKKDESQGIKRARPDDDDVSLPVPPTQKIRHELNEESVSNQESEMKPLVKLSTDIESKTQQPVRSNEVSTDIESKTQPPVQSKEVSTDMESKTQSATESTQGATVSMTQPTKIPQQQPVTKMITITTTLPEGCKPGDTMMTPYGSMGQMTSFVVPEGSKPGDTLELTLTAPQPSPPPAFRPPAPGQNGFPNLQTPLDPVQWAQFAARLVQMGIPPSMWPMASGMMPPFVMPGQLPGGKRTSMPKKQLTKEERDERARKQALAQGFRKELAYRRKLYRSHTEKRPQNLFWPPKDPLDSSKTLELPRIAVSPFLKDDLVERKYENEQDEIYELWEKRFWLALAKKKIPKQPKMHAVLWCEGLLYQANILGIQNSNSLIKTLKEGFKTSLANIRIKGSRSAQRFNVRVKMGGNSLSFEDNRVKPYLRPSNRLLALIKHKSKKSSSKARSKCETAKTGNNIPRLSSQIKKKSKKKHNKSSGKRVRKGQWMDDWSNWIVYETRRENESLETISHLAGVPPLETLWKWNRKRYPSIKKSSPLILGTHVLIRPDHEKIHGAPPAPVWKGKPWNPRVGVQIQARWNGGREVGFPGYYPAMITSVSKNKKMLGLKYYDGSTDTAVAIHNVRTKYTSFGVSWPHITANNLFGHEYEDLEQCMRHEKKFKTATSILMYCLS